MASSPTVPLKKVTFYRYDFVTKHGTKEQTSENGIHIVCRKDYFCKDWICNDVRDLNLVILDFYFPNEIEFYWVNETLLGISEAKDTRGSFKRDIKKIYTAHAFRFEKFNITKEALLAHYVPLIGQAKIDEYISSVIKLRRRIRLEEAQADIKMQHGFYTGTETPLHFAMHMRQINQSISEGFTLDPTTGQPYRW